MSSLTEKQAHEYKRLNQIEKEAKKEANFYKRFYSL